MLDDFIEREVDGVMFRYSPSTGRLWRYVTHQGPRALLFPHWRETGLMPSRIGYILIGIGRNKLVLGHRLAWFIVCGAWPQDEIDHIDHCRSNNKWGNLREVSHRENLKNATIRKTNTSGVTGVYWNKKNKKWVAQIVTKCGVVSLGLFVKIEQAIAARKSAEITHGFHKNHGL